METGSNTAKIVFIYPDGKVAVVLIIPESVNCPVPVLIKNSSYTVGHKIRLRKDIKAVEKTTNNSTKFFVFVKGEQNFKVLPDFYKAEVKYISDSGKYAAVSVRINGYSDSVLAFFHRHEEVRKGQTIDISTAQKVYPVKKADGSVFYFFKEGLCNFIIASTIRSSYSAYDDWLDYDQSKEDYYEELGNSVCEYCGEYHCDCQRSLDEQWDSQFD